MWLTTQMHAELDDIIERINEISQKCALKIKCTTHDTMTCGLLSTDRESSKKNIDLAITEMNSIKVRLENILCETDEKEQVFS